MAGLELRWMNSTPRCFAIFFGRVLMVALALCVGFVFAEPSEYATIFAARGFDPTQIALPTPTDKFPANKLRNVTFKTVAKTELFPEGPSYRPSDDSYFFSGNHALTRVDSDGKTHLILGKPGGGGTHFLSDGSVLIIGESGLRRLFSDGRIALLADGKKTGGGNDLTLGKFGEVYFSVPRSGIYRLTPGADGKLEKVVEQGANGLDVDPAGEFLYVVRKNVERYRITGADSALGEAETVFEFPKGEGGGDGCTFDVWGNLYTMKFSSGVIRVIDPTQGVLLAEIPTGVEPASNLTFGGLKNTDLFVTAGAPKHKNCMVLKAHVGITGFCGHVGSIEYPVIRYLDREGPPASH